MTKKYYNRIVKWTFKVLAKCFGLTNQDARIYQVFPSPKHRFFDRDPKRMIEVEGENRSMLVIEAEQHQIDEVKKAYRKADIVRNKSEREQYLLRDLEEAEE